MKYYELNLVFLFILLLSMLVIASAIISIGTVDVTATANSSNVSVPVTLNNNVSVAVLQFQVNHSELLIFKGVQPTARMPNATIETNNIAPNVLGVAAFIPDNISVGSGTILNLIFDVNSSALPGVYPLNMAGVLLSNIEMDALSYNSSNSLFTIV